jgi:hypothetical protein
MDLRKISKPVKLIWIGPAENSKFCYEQESILAGSVRNLISALCVWKSTGHGINHFEDQVLLLYEYQPYHFLLLGIGRCLPWQACHRWNDLLYASDSLQRKMSVEVQLSQVGAHRLPKLS